MKICFIFIKMKK